MQQERAAAAQAADEAGERERAAEERRAAAEARAFEAQRAETEMVHAPFRRTLGAIPDPCCCRALGARAVSARPAAS